LTKRYSILSNSVGGVVEFGLATALLYMAMSLPLSWLSRSMEKKLDGVNKKGA
jgi:polar amino acid transport system substrate-binding protein